MGHLFQAPVPIREGAATDVQSLRHRRQECRPRQAGLYRPRGTALHTRSRTRTHHCSSLVSAITGVPAQRTDDVERPDARVDPCVRGYASDHHCQSYHPPTSLCSRLARLSPPLSGTSKSRTEGTERSWSWAKRSTTPSHRTRSRYYAPPTPQRSDVGCRTIISLLKLTCSTRHADAERQGQIRQDEKGVSPVQVLCAQS